MKYLNLIFFCTMLLNSYSQDNNKVNPDVFPAAKEGYEKIIIQLKSKRNENNLKLEFTVGKVAKVDKCNHHFLVGSMKDINLEGYGYIYYEFISDGMIAGTKMGCMDDELADKFIAGGKSIIDYNSKIPVVIYVPKDMKVEYRIWKTKKKWSKT